MDGYDGINLDECGKTLIVPGPFGPSGGLIPVCWEIAGREHLAKVIFCHAKLWWGHDRGGVIWVYSNARLDHGVARSIRGSTRASFRRSGLISSPAPSCIALR